MFSFDFIAYSPFCLVRLNCIHTDIAIVFRLHELRHSYAIAALQAGDDIKTLQENLGHHTAAFTLDTYAHVTARMKRESSARMDSFIKSVKKL